MATPPPNEGAEPAINQVARFASALSQASNKATFTCGGRIPNLTSPSRDTTGNLTPRTADKRRENRILTKPVSIRWGEKDGEGRVISLPATNPSDEKALRDLIEACTPATFGQGGKDVLDEGYRNAGALGPEKFMSDFCPYETGIIDIVTQLLLPSDLRPGQLALFHPETHLSRPQVEELAEKVKEFSEANGEIHAIKLGQYLHALGVGIQDGEMLNRRLAYMLDLEAQQLSCELPMGNARFAYMSAHEAVNIAAGRVLQRENARREVEHYEKERNALTRRERHMMCRGLRAELYKLNVYSGPSGLFKKHVDTPRAENQVGSLVVCLPVGFEGMHITTFILHRHLLTDLF